MSEPKQIVSKHEPVHGSVRTYVAGFAVSVILTLIAFGLVETHHKLTTTTVMSAIVVLALIQFIVQLFFFLHLGRETRPRWKLITFYLAIGVVLILVLGSLWIMANLNYRMTPNQMNNYLKSQDGL